MDARRLVLCALVGLIPATASAQLDDFLEPLTEEAPKSKPSKSKSKSKPKPRKKATATKPTPPQQPEKSLLDGVEIEPLVSQGEILVKVTGPADGAKVSLNGRDVKPGERVQLEAGEVTVQVRRPGWSDGRRQVTLAPGQRLEVAVALDPVAGVLTVGSDVPGSAVLLNGKVLGTTPLGGNVVPPGMHEVIVRKDGFVDHVSRLSIRAGRDYVVQANLRPAPGSGRVAAVEADRPEATRLVPDPSSPPQSGLALAATEEPTVAQPWYGRWYVWAGVGAVAVAATSAAVMSRNTAGTAPPSPSEVCRGECDAVINGPAAMMGRFGAGAGIPFGR